ncbi:hypothetical protein [Rhizobium sp. SAFR-030]|uniref:hypothetical protein n=1 Tax=Rhizobium sp. SAFR-030 TaxID=3387277 RepID=UPI003F7EC89E
MNSANRISVTLVLIFLATAQVLSLLYYYGYFSVHGYLPSPFVYDKSDTFMDFFHVLYWSADSGRYSVWGSVYPPLNFLLMRLVGLISLGSNSFMDGFEIRDYSFALRIFVVASSLFLVALTMISRLWKDLTAADRVAVFLFYALSAPLLFATERGNIILLCLPLLAGVMASCGIRRLIFIAILINLKPYFALLLLTPLVAGRWQDFLFIAMCAGVIFVVSGLLLDPDFLYFLPNILSFGQNDMVFSGREVLALPATIAAFAYALAVAVRDGASLGQSGLDLAAVSTVINNANLAALVMSMAALLSARNRLPQTQLFAFQIVMICNLGVWVGGYSLIFYPLIVPSLLYFRLRWVYIASIMILLSPLDLVVLWRDILPDRPVYSTGAIAPIEYQLTLGTLLRPPLNFILIVSISLEILVRSWLPRGSGVNRQGAMAV